MMQLAATALVVSYVGYRAVLHEVVPFWADAPLARADQLMHFGRHPYTLLPRWPSFARFLDLLYYPVWFMLAPAAIGGWAWFLRGRERARAFLAFFMTWAFLGAALGTLFSSAGPVYAERLGITDAFVPLSNYLETLGLRAVGGHEGLWRGYIGQDIDYGITAMPSMHVALPALVTLTVWRWRVPRLLGLLLTVLTVIASVQLAWHYAIDGYVSILGVVLLWRLADRIISYAASPIPEGSSR